jgi:hypothetical protein
MTLTRFYLLVFFLLALIWMLGGCATGPAPDVGPYQPRAVLPYPACGELPSWRYRTRDACEVR